jgi:asparagine synthase (glutamine-hydrolysing)
MLQGNFSFLIKDKDKKVIACVDKIRSFPLFYSYSDKTLFISDSPHTIREKINTNKEYLSFLEFQMSGYVSGRDTLFKEIKQLQAAEFLYYDGSKIDVRNYYLFYQPKNIELSEEKLIDKLHDINCSIFKRLIQRLNGRPVLLALSAGLDSRLILCLLKYLKYDNINTFSYGIPGNWDARWAATIARKLKVNWFFLPYTRGLGQKVFSSQEYLDYAQFAHRYTSLPFILDFPALWQLKRSNKLPDNTVMLNGQTGDFISGNHISDSFNQDKVSREVFFQAVIKKHYSLWENLHTEDNLRKIKNKITGVLPLPLQENMDRDYAMKLYELWECRERQAKYVINGQRPYDFFKLSWELPLWDDQYLYFWSALPFKYKFKQTLYKKYLEKFDFFAVFRNVNFYKYSSPAYINLFKYFFWIFGKKRFYYRKMLLSYWQNDAYYYSLYSYKEYLKYAKYHRSAISYHIRHFLENEYQEKF